MFEKEFGEPMLGSMRKIESPQNTILFYFILLVIISILFIWAQEGGSNRRLKKIA
jgi:hypothetical protein